tara:strand:+ start:819 stop:1037 length:219 start_codon:yes stop_codon:yes gene_type:complete
MNGKSLVEWRESVSADLSELRSDVRWIKANLEKFDNRQRSLEKQVSWLKGVGSLVGVVLGSGLALVVNIIMR